MKPHVSQLSKTEKYGMLNICEHINWIRQPNTIENHLLLTETIGFEQNQNLIALHNRHTI